VDLAELWRISHIDLMALARSKPLHPIGSSLKDLREMPEAVRRAFGGALRFAQLGGYPEGCRPFGEGLPREILKLAEHHEGDTYRAAFVLAFEECVYLLHVFKKKSASGKATPRPDKQTILARWQVAREDYRARYVRKAGEP
jgi:phage-related protein